MQYVSPDDATRQESTAADKAANDWATNTLTRVDVYEALLDAEKHTKDNNVKLNDEEKRLLDRMLLDRKRNGLGLSQEKRDEYVKLKQEISRRSVSTKCCLFGCSDEF